MTQRVAHSESEKPVHAYFEARPVQAVLLGIVLVTLGVWAFTKVRRAVIDDPYADPLGTDYLPIYPAELAAPVPLGDAA